MDQATELEKQWRAAAKLDRERAELLGLLVRHPGWQVFCDLINLKLEADGQQLMAPLASMDDLPKAEHLKGTMYGLVLARDLPTVIVEQMKAATPAEENDNAE